MTYQLTIRDEKTTGELIGEHQIGFAQQTVTIKVIIEARMKQEVQNYNSKQPEHFRGLVEPTDAKRTLLSLYFLDERVLAP